MGDPRFGLVIFSLYCGSQSFLIWIRCKEQRIGFFWMSWFLVFLVLTV